MTDKKTPEELSDAEMDSVAGGIVIDDGAAIVIDDGAAIVADNGAGFTTNLDTSSLQLNKTITSKFRR